MSKFFFMTEWLNVILTMFLYGKSYYIWFGKFIAVTHGQLYELALIMYELENADYSICFFSMLYIQGVPPKCMHISQSLRLASQSVNTFLGDSQYFIKTLSINNSEYKC